MSHTLIIVESPTKAKTIEKYLGPDYEVSSCNGHIRNLPKKEIGVDVQHSFKPHYIVEEGKKKLIDTLRKKAQNASQILLASDDDREGEAIAWHLKEVLNLNQPERIVFREITKKAIQASIEHPRSIDQSLVNSQQARRILDRLVGYNISPLLWKKIKPGLSAGRVQSVTLRLIVEMERKIHQFQPISSYQVKATFHSLQGEPMEALFSKKIASHEGVLDLLTQCKDALFHAKSVVSKQVKRSPQAPFTTSTLQQVAHRELGFSVAKTMRVAQRLYELGHITYMRTDAVRLSEEAIEKVGEAIATRYGSAYHQQRKYKNQDSNAQEAHEAIRPTVMKKEEVTKDYDGARLYRLIWRRTIASQMSDAIFDKTTIHIATKGIEECFVAQGEIMQFAGFLKVYEEKQDNHLLPKVSQGEKVELESIEAKERFSKPPARYTQGSLVNTLKKLGIGRPSTYASTIATVLKRNYAVEENRSGRAQSYKQIDLKKKKITTSTLTETVGSEKRKLFPTDMGFLITDLMVELFPNVMDYNFTAQIENQLDQIAHKKLGWQHMLTQFYDILRPQLIQAQSIDRSKLVKNKVHHLGNHPQTGVPIYTRLSPKYGPLIQMGEIIEDGPKPRFSKLRPGQLLEQISLEEAIDLFRLPRQVGIEQGEEIIAHEGRFGPYIRYKGKFYGLSKEYDPHTITKEEAIQLILTKEEADRKSLILQFTEEPVIEVRKGKWGHYIKSGKKIRKVPSEQDPESLTREQCQAILDAQKKRRKTTRKK